MLISRRQLKRRFIKAISEAFGFGFDSFNDTAEEVIAWNDPKRLQKIKDYKSSGRDDYVIQNPDNIDPRSLSHKDRIQYVNDMADKLTSEFESKAQKHKAAEAEKDEIAMDAFIARLKRRRSMTLDQVVDDNFNSDISDNDTTVIDSEFDVTRTANFNQYG